MREIERIDRILELIKTIWKDNQDFRFGQLLINLGVVEDSFNLWNIQDETIEEYLEKWIKEE